MNREFQVGDFVKIKEHFYGDKLFKLKHKYKDDVFIVIPIKHVFPQLYMNVDRMILVTGCNTELWKAMYD